MRKYSVITISVVLFGVVFAANSYAAPIPPPPTILKVTINNNSDYPLTLVPLPVWMNPCIVKTSPPTPATYMQPAPGVDHTTTFTFNWNLCFAQNQFLADEAPQLSYNSTVVGSTQPNGSCTFQFNAGKQGSSYCWAQKVSQSGVLNTCSVTATKQSGDTCNVTLSFGNVNPT